MSSREFYPFPTFRPGVEAALDKIDAAAAAGKRFILVGAATGSGKSAIATAFARKNKAVILTPTKLLQHQYADTPEFKSHEFVVFGKSNYFCGLDQFSPTPVDEAICCSDAVAKANSALIPWADEPGFWKLDDRPSKALKKKCSQTGTCPYYSLISQIGVKNGAVLNYDLFAHIKKMNAGPHGIDMGDFLVMDEAHQLINKIKSVFGYRITVLSACRVLGDGVARKPGEGPVVWLSRLARTANEKLKKETDTKTASSIQRFESRLAKILEQEISNPAKFHIDDTFEEIEIKPLDFRHLKGPLFYPFKTVLMLSATFPANFAKLLGITPDEVQYIEIPSTFAPENRPAVVVRGMLPLNYKTVLDAKHTAKIALDGVLEQHKDQKGIIHCSNYKFFNQLRELYRGNPRFMWVDRDDDKAACLAAHIESKNPSILVSPSMMEGVDLKDDAARFQVLLKLPFPTLDDYTKKMMNLFEDYYENLVITSVVQTYGRAVRSEEDYASLYILDGAINRLLGQYRNLFPKYFTEALVSATIL